MTPTKDERRNEIIQAAFAAFAANGYAKTTMDDIVQHSGLSKGTLYWYFKNKQELFVATIEVAFQEMSVQLATLVEQDAPATDRLRMFFIEAGKMLEQNKPIVGLLVDAFFQSYQNEEAMQTMRTLYQDYISSIEIIIQQGIVRGEFRDVDPHMAAVSLMAGGDGVALYMLIEPGWELSNALTMITDLLLRGLKKE